MTHHSYGYDDLAPHRQAIEADLRDLAQRFEDNPHYREMAAMIAHHLGWPEQPSQSGGKRVRPLIALLCCQAVGGDWRQALPVASSVELIHNFSLVHDDIQDESDTRRGRPTIWRRWGIAQAINTGDAIFVLARLACHRLQARGLAAETILSIHQMLDEACLRLTMGQHLDLWFEDQDQVSQAAYFEMIEGKTASLLAASAAAGALIAQVDAGRVDAIFQFGLNLGLAFQIMDDLLGIWGAPESTGKPAGDDLLAHKKSLPVILGLERSATFRELWQPSHPDEMILKKMMQELVGVNAQTDAQNAAEKHTQMAVDALESACEATPARDHLLFLTENLLHRQQ